MKRRTGYVNSSQSGMQPDLRHEFLQNLDRELELLQQKRRFIEEEQYGHDRSSSRQHPISPWENSSMSHRHDPLSNKPRPLFDFAEPLNSRNSGRRSYTEGRGYTNSRSYAETGYQGSRGYSETNERPKKRKHSNNPPSHWRDIPKRFRGPEASGLPKKPNNPPSKAKPVTKPFPTKPNTVAKAKPMARQIVPVKNNPSHVATKKNLSSEIDAKENMTRRTRTKRKVGEVDNTGEYVLTSHDMLLPKAVQGRIQFAVGTLYKQFRERHENDGVGNVFNNINHKFFKKTIRWRILSILLGKPIGPVGDIVKQYNAQYPESADEELLELTDKEFDVSVHPSKYIKKDLAAVSPSEYYKKNMHRVLEIKVEEMLGRLYTVYEKVDQEELAKLIEDIEENTPFEEQRNDQVTTNDSVKSAENVTEAETVENKSNDEKENKADDNINNENKAESIDNVNNESEVIDNTTNESKDKVIDNVNNETVSKINKNYDRKKRLQDLSKLMNGLIAQELPKVLPTFKQEIINIFNLDQQYLQARQYVSKVAINMSNKLAATNPTKFLVLVGIPKLPPKVKLQGFLKSFNPSTIKKHRTIPNFLYIGFNCDDDLKKLLQKNNMMFEKCQLSIKESGSKKSNPELEVNLKKELQETESGKDEAKTDNSVTEESNKVEVLDLTETEQEQTAETDESINKDGVKDLTGPVNSANSSLDAVDQIDDQISDLLQSIRRDHENQLNVDDNNPEAIKESNEEEKNGKLDELQDGNENNQKSLESESSNTFDLTDEKSVETQVEVENDNNKNAGNQKVGSTDVKPTPINTRRSSRLTK